MHGEKRDACRISTAEPAGKRPLGRPRRKWEDNIKTGLRQDGVVWTGLIWLKIRTGGRLL
jgi:hypothetical protein